jgi:hypothetical protein
LGWNDGKTETFAFTEVDRTVTLGAQVAGNRWRRAEDRLGVAYVVNGLSADHRDYLSAGGQGVLGHGALTYGTERILEAYYRMQLGKYAQLSPDIQYIQNPGYNRDRGRPALSACAYISSIRVKEAAMPKTRRTLSFGLPVSSQVAAAGEKKEFIHAVRSASITNLMGMQGTVR